MSHPSVLVAGPKYGGDASRSVVGGVSLALCDAVCARRYLGYGEAAVGLLKSEGDVVAKLIRGGHGGDGPVIHGMVSAGFGVRSYAGDCLDMEGDVEIRPCCKGGVPGVQVVDDVFGCGSKVVLSDDGPDLAWEVFEAGARRRRSGYEADYCESPIGVLRRHRVGVD